MKKVAPELESLMWTLAEEGNERAIDEFGSRHPELRTELLHRIAMVKGLRGEKKRIEEPKKAIPRFVPKQATSRGPVYVVGTLVLAAVCALAFAVTTLLTPRTHVAPGDIVAGSSQPPLVKRPPAPYIPPQVNPLPPPPPQREASPPDTDTDLKPVDLHIKHASLLAVLAMIGEKCHVQINPAPGMSDPDVVADYRNENAMEMLRDLGLQYGFTAFDQHNGTILVVPAVENNSPGLQWQESTSGKQTQKIGG